MTEAPVARGSLRRASALVDSGALADTAGRVASGTFARPFRPVDAPPPAAARIISMRRLRWLGPVAAAAVSAAAGCGGEGTQPAAAAPPDTTGPRVTYTVARASDTTYALDGEATDDRAVTSVTWVLASADGIPLDTISGAVRVAPSRSVRFHAELPPRAGGRYWFFVIARDSADNPGWGPEIVLDFRSLPAGLLQVSVAAPSGDALTQRGVELVVSRRDRRGIGAATFFVDSGTASQQQFRWPYNGWSFPFDTVRMLVYAPGPGTHTFRVNISDAGIGPIPGVSITRTFVFADVPYAVTILPDLGLGAGVRGVNDAGDVAGWVATPQGRTQPAVWRGGVLRVVPTDTGNAAAVRVNGAGDVLLQRYDRGAPSGAVVRRADGVDFPVGISTPIPGSRASSCCAVAVGLNDARQAVATTYDYLVFYGSVVLDVARGVVTDTSAARLTAINGAGKLAGTVSDAPNLYISTRLFTPGFTPPPLPAGTTVNWSCDLPRRSTRITAIDLDEDASLLADYCGNPVLLPTNGRPVWLDRFVGRGQIHLAPRGGLVASLDPSGSVFLWRPGSTTSTRVRLADARWRLDSLAGVSSAGAIAAHGIDAATGRGAALVLTPVP